MAHTSNLASLFFKALLEHSLSLPMAPKAEVSSYVDTRDGQHTICKAEMPFGSLQKKTKLLALSLGRPGICFEIATGINMY